jgi:hypothetical protein
MAATSGTVATYTYTNMKIIDHACRRAGLLPQKLGSEDLEVCLDLLFTLSAEWTNAGFPLWTTQFRLLGCQIGSPDVPTLSGTMEVLHSYWRIFMPYRGACTLTDDSGDILLFGGQPNDDVVVPGPDPSVSVNFTSVTETDTIGVLMGGSTALTTELELYTSEDGATWTLAQTLPSATYEPGAWTYFDLNPTISTQFLRITYDTQGQAGTWTLNQLQFALANGQDIENGPLNIDDYYNLPNKQFQASRPNSTYQQRNIDVPTLKIWPTLNTEGFYNGTISCLSRRYIQDPGRLTDIMELPIRWYEAITWRLASRVIHEIQNPELRTADSATKQMLMQDRTARIPVCDKEAEKSEMLAWSEERVRAPIRLFPNLAPYTR